MTVIVLFGSMNYPWMKEACVHVQHLILSDPEAKKTYSLEIKIG